MDASDVTGLVGASDSDSVGIDSSEGAFSSAVSHSYSGAIYSFVCATPSAEAEALALLSSLVDNVVVHPLPRQINDPSNTFGLHRRVVSVSVPFGDGSLSFPQVLKLVGHVAPLSNFLPSNSVLRKRKSAQLVPMIARAPVSDIQNYLLRQGFHAHTVEPTADIVMCLQYCVWVLEVTLMPRDSVPRHRDHCLSSVQHVLTKSRPGKQNLEADTQTHILYCPGTSSFYTRFAPSNDSYIPLPVNWLRLLSTQGLVADGSFIESYTPLLQVFPGSSTSTHYGHAGVHYPDNHELTPFIPPDTYLPIKCNIGPIFHTFLLTLMERQRLYKDKLFCSPSFRSLCRRYIQGAIFTNPHAFASALTITPSMLEPRPFDIHVKVLDGFSNHASNTTCIRVTKCTHIDVLAAGRELCLTLPNQSSSVRRASRQEGSMHSFGRHVFNGRLHKFKETVSQSRLLKSFTRLFSSFLLKSFPLEHASMVSSERSRGLLPDTSSFDSSSPCSSLNVSVDLANPDHYDIRDISVGVSLFLTDSSSESVKGWYFVMPNLEVLHCGKSYRGVLIQLQHGIALSWDGRYIRHCSSSGVTSTPGNRRYGLHMAANGPTAKMVEARSRF